MRKKRSIIAVFALLASLQLFEQEGVSQGSIHIDHEGVLRWEHSGEEIYGFGINYTVPFAHAYRAARLLGVDLKQAIREDVYHFARLGLDLFRIHVWDTEVSDTLGNLLENDHMDVLDFLLKELKALFFVKDFAGNPQYDERKKYLEGEKPTGRRVEVTFKDGETLVGSTLGYDPSRPGFFLFPADPKSNNIRVFAVSPFVKNVRYV